jgi:hypothetical protein
MDKIGVFLSFIGATATAFFFAYKGATQWRYYKEPANEDDDKKRKIGKSCFFGGTSFFVVSVVILAVLWNNIPEEPPVPPNGNVTTTTDGTAAIETTNNGTENVPEASNLGTGNVFVENKRYVAATYSGYVGEERVPHGRGIMRWDNGNTFDGEWYNGLISGHGRMTYANGDTYVGEWENNVRHGMGTYTWADGRIYVGEYINDMRHGEGIFTDWVDISTGFRGTYVGESKNDKFEGQGVFTFDNGDKFEGNFKEDVAWNGTYTRSNGSRYQIENGEPRR